MEPSDFASRILEEFGGDDYLMIESLLRMRSDSLANQFKTDASAVLCSKNRQYATVSETITTNNHEVAAGTSVGKIDASDIKNNEKTIGESSFDESSKEIKENKERSKSKKRKITHNNGSISHQSEEEQPEPPLAFNEKIEQMEGTEGKLVNQNELINSDVTINNGHLSIPKGRVNESFLTPARESYLDYGRNKIKRIADILSHSFNRWDEMCLKNKETAVEELDKLNTNNSETAAEKFIDPNTENKERVAKEFDNPNTNKNNEIVDKESSFNEGSKTKLKKIKTNKKLSKRTSKINNNGSISLRPEIEVPGLPLVFKEKIEQMGGIEVKLVIQKELTNSDLTQNNGRLSIPKGKVIESFLTPAEESYLDYEREKKEKIAGMYVSLLDHNLNLWDEMCLKKWKMETAEVYNITDGWNELVAENEWKKDEKVLVQLWSFRRNHKLYFALVKL